mgnify:CR=1 FL=1
MVKIGFDHADGLTVCQPVGELDAYTVPDFRERLTEAATILGLRVLDHIIVAKKAHFSFQAAGLIA